MNDRVRIAVIADIQGNGVALEQALYQIKHDGVDAIICLGDLVSGPEPVRVLELLHTHEVICVRGNMDDVILNPPIYAGTDADERKYSAMDHWCHAQLSAADCDYLSALPLTYAFEIGAHSGLCFHGSPRSTEGVIAATTPDEQLSDMLSAAPYSILMTGHMHLPMLRTFGEQIIMNPGSIGLPYGGKRLMHLRAEYAVLSVTDDDFNIAFHQAQYDAETFKQHLLSSNMPHAAWYLSKWKSTNNGVP